MQPFLIIDDRASKRPATAADHSSHDKIGRYSSSHQRRNMSRQSRPVQSELSHAVSEFREFRVSRLPLRGRVVDRRWQITFSSDERMDARMNPARCLARRHPYRHGWHVDVDSLIFHLNHSGMHRLLALVECITAAPQPLRERGWEFCCVSFPSMFLFLHSAKSNNLFPLESHANSNFAPATCVGALPQRLIVLAWQAQCLATRKQTERLRPF